jgi:hypothetical protein
MFPTKINFYRLLLLISLTLVTVVSPAQVPDEIIQGLKTGNAKIISDYFSQNVELVILENDNVYSKSQAQQIVTNFFAKYRPESFNVFHQSGKEDSKYLIGNLKTNAGVFRVYIYLINSEGKAFIHQLRIEKQE